MFLGRGFKRERIKEITDPLNLTFGKDFPDYSNRFQNIPTNKYFQVVNNII